jgi:hypothetical protein
MQISAFTIPNNPQEPIFPELICFDVSHPDMLQNELYTYDSEVNANLAKEIFEELEYTVTIVPTPKQKEEIPSELIELLKNNPKKMPLE